MSAMTEVCLLQVSNPAPGEGKRSPSAVQVSMRSAAKWQSCLCSADDADMAHQETDAWAKLHPDPGEKTPGGPGWESGSSVNQLRDIF